MNAELRKILNDVAAGNLTPEAADAAISALPGALPQTALEDAPAAEDQRIVRVRIHAGALKLRVIGDPTVAEAVAEGSHRFERDGDTLVLHSMATESVGSYSAATPRSGLMSFLSQMMNMGGGSLAVRVNPQLQVEVVDVAGMMHLSGMHAGVLVNVATGQAQVVDGSGPLALDVGVGMAEVNWTFSGESHVQVEMGQARVQVSPDSNVVVKAVSSMGRAVIKQASDAASPAESAASNLSLEAPVTVGAGEGSLTVSAQMGFAEVIVT